MKTAEVVFYEKPKMKNPVVIQGLPGVGNVGRAVAGYLISQWKAKKIAEIISPELVPVVSINQQSVIETLTIQFYHARKNRRDFIIVTGDSQAVTNTGHYRLSWEIAKLLKELGASFIITVGGFVHERARASVIGAVTQKEIMEEFSGTGVVFNGNKIVSSIVGEAGLVLAMAKRHAIEGICLMGKVQPHPGIITDPKAAREILKVLQKYLNIRINLKEIEKSVEEMERLMKDVISMVEAMPKHRKNEGYIG